jgi:uncharacterized protein (TIGR03435 family)
MLNSATRLRLLPLLLVLGPSDIVVAQSQLKFDVASVKPSMENTMSVRVMPGARLVATAPLKLLIMKAYGLQYARVIGGPEWINNDRFEIQAKPAQDANPAQVMTMLQNLLEERFRMKVRRENREVPVYDLVVDKGGAKLAPTKIRECPPIRYAYAFRTARCSGCSALWTNADRAIGFRRADGRRPGADR